MNAISRITLTSLCAGAALSTACAFSQTDDFQRPPKVLVLQREYMKPGKAGSLHEKSESAFVRAMAAAKWPVHYVAMESWTGANRALFMTGYDSFAAWEKDNMDQSKNAILSAAMDNAWAADSQLVNSTDQGAFAFRDDISQPAAVEIASERFFDISMYKVKQGHEKEWVELNKIYQDGYKKAAPEVSWATYQSIYGADNGGMYLIIQPMKSASEVDKVFSDNKKFEAAIGPAGMKRLAELTAACVESMQENLFHFNPKMSYVSDRFKAIDPEFWKPKAMAAPKPAADVAAKP